MPNSLPDSTRVDGKPTVIRLRPQAARRFRQWPIVLATFLLVLVSRHLIFGQAVTQSDLPTGTSYYVDSVDGNDKNAGTSASAPWKTLAKVNERTFTAGDAILLKSGAKWTGQLWPKGSGSEQRPIVIDKYGGEAKPILEGAGRVKAAVLLKNQEVLGNQ